MSITKNSITREYDALNRIRKAEYPEDRAGQRKEMIPKYNKGGALLSLKVGGVDFVKEIAYNARGQRILLAMGNGIMTRYTYDPQTFRKVRTRSEKFTEADHAYTPNGGVQQDLAYTYDLEGTITSMNDAAPANASAQGPGNLLRQFNHDPLRRLLSATGRESSNVYQQPSWDLNIRPHDHTATNTYTRSYAYDKLGNIQKLKHVADGKANQDFNRDYTYGAENNRLTAFSVGGTQYTNTYDANGNLTKEGENRHYEWNANDKLAVFKNQAGASTPTVYTNYFYNAQGERVKKHTRKGNKVTVTVYMDGGMFEVSYVKPTGTDIDNNRFYNTLHVLDGTSRIATMRVGNNADDSTPATKYNIEDHLGNSTVVLDTSGNLVNREEFYPFGETSFGGFAKKRYRYNRKEKDAESGLYYYGARYYSAWTSRFISTDPKSSAAPNFTPYHYCSNNPINRIDPDGMQDEPSGGGEGPVKKGDTFVGDDGQTYTASVEEVVITGTKSLTATSNQETKTEAAENLSPTSFTYTLDYEANSSNIPFVESYRHAAGTFTNVLETGEISDFVEGDTGGGFNITLKVPKIYPHNRDNPTFTTYTGTGSDLDNLTWEKETSLGQAFVDGFNAGWRVGLSTAIQEELATAILFKRFNLSNAKSFEGADPELLRVFFKKKGWKINPTQNRGFRATNPNDKYDVFHIVRGNASKLKPDSNIPKVKQGDYLKRPADKLWPERTPLKRNPALN